MEERVFTSYSKALSRDMSFKTFGDGRGKLAFAFPPQNGRYWDFENFGMVEAIRPFIEDGKIFLVLADSIDWESWSLKGPERPRIEAQERYYHYVVDELYPEAKKLSKAKKRDKALVTGCSMGGVHAGIFFFRRPDLFDSMISLSGTFNAQHFFGPYMDDLIYDNSPSHFLRNMSEDHPYIKLYNQSKIITCVGQGAWEEMLLEGTRELDRILTEKGIRHFSDYWGFDVNHDWPWWQKQLPYFLKNFIFE